MQPLVTT